MYIQRTIDTDLIEWKNSQHRKPLLIRGARQVGKSTAVRNLAKEFISFVEINFDEQPLIRTLFEKVNSIDELLEQLAIIYQIQIIEGETLLFFDEIQACLPAISLLRYFHEKKPNLHIVAAGSLLEFALTELPSFGVGRIRSIFMYPLSFNEFLTAMNESQLLKLIEKSDSQHPISPILHEKLKLYLKKFFIIGGMPEVVNAYVQRKNLIEVQRILDDLVISIQSDFSKYHKRISINRIQSVFENVIQQIGSKFKFSSQFSELNGLQVKQVIDLLELAGLVNSVTHSSCNGIPLGAESNVKKRKFLIFDTGIFQRILGLDVSTLLLNDDYEIINKGNIAELFVGLELIKTNSPYEKTPLYYWHRESKSSQSEVDYVIQKGEHIIPIEVKSGTKGTMQSLHIFMSEKSSHLGIRCSLENFGTYNNIEILPLYAISQLRK
jgi:predicted AAA+ superfamily ATPase